LLGSVNTPSFVVLLTSMLAHRKAQYAGVMLSATQKHKVQLLSLTIPRIKMPKILGVWFN